MKKNLIFAALVAASVFVACTKEDAGLSVQTEKIVKTVELLGVFGEDVPEADAKAGLGALNDKNNCPFVWATGDAVKAYIANKALSNVAVVQADDNWKPKADFSISFTESEVPAEGSEDKMLFIFPAGKGDPTITEAGFSFTFPATQYAAQNAFPKDGNGNQLAATVAQTESARDVYDEKLSTLNFSNVFALVSLTLGEGWSDVQKISLVGNNNEVLTGTYNIKADATIALDASKTSYKEATLAYKSGSGSFTVGAKYYIVIAPTTFENGFTIRVTLNDGSEWEKSSPDQKYVFGRSSVNDLQVLDKAKFAKIDPTPGITASRTMWAKFANAWYADFTGSANIRNIAMDDQYVYLVHAGGPGIHVVNLMDGVFVKSLSTTGIANGTHLTSDANVIPYENGTKLLVCNLASGNGSILKLYAYDSVDADPKVLLSFTLPEAYRFGDHFTVEGTWENGRLLFYDYNQTGKVAIFTITDGKVLATPEYMTLNVKPGGNIGAMYKYPYNDSEYMWAGANGRMHVYSVSGLSATRTLQITDGGTFSADINGVSFFTVAGRNYMAHVGTYDSRTSARLKIAELKGASLKESMSGITHPWNFYLAGNDASAKGTSNGNATGDAAFRIIDGKVYLAANTPGSGIRVVELK